jgi:ABC-2 type transport system ATP-binding protein
LVSTHYMDEAVQCDYIAYIAYGKKLISGPAPDIPDMIGLSTWLVEGPDITKLETELRAISSVEQVARFGAVLHVSGVDAPALDALAATQMARGTHRWQKQKGGLEEAFIYLMSSAVDNFTTDKGKKP